MTRSKKYDLQDRLVDYAVQIIKLLTRNLEPVRHEKITVVSYYFIWLSSRNNPHGCIRQAIRYR